MFRRVSDSGNNIGKGNVCREKTEKVVFGCDREWYEVGKYDV